MSNGAKDKLTGKAKEVAGKATGDKRLESEGETDQAKGKVKEASEAFRERAEGVKDSLRGDEPKGS
ncbi:CsbD family protein [Yinghuangia soli]|uniref:CsbD family protein n=1 Tax=Yinghuangia soli TaxID=2908204 RepID=A0AA41Q476_9ACTN|nr:CsbD family protein [Yinghuangia soli]MCF2531011.1 CsbD family protein [Yinghuangia soli]